MNPLSYVPGYTALRRGDASIIATWQSLAVSLLFFAVLDVALVCQWGWTTWWTATALGACGLWVTFAIAWMILLLLLASLNRQSTSKQPSGSNAEILFAEAMGHYLRGNWFETEAALQAILRCHPHDTESLLFYATLLRRMQRLDEAREQLRRLTLLDAACLWRAEVATEKKHVNYLKTTAKAPPVATLGVSGCCAG